jgi:hypothetical protein
MEIQIAGYSVLIDDEDIEKVKHINWHPQDNRGIIYFVKHTKIGGKDKILYLHRIIMNDPTGKEVDHRNLNTLDNRKENLRVCTHAENLMNRKKHKDNTSGYKGVDFSKDHNKWRALICINYKRKHLRYYNTPEETYNAYCEASKKYHGEFGRVS